MTNLLFKRPDGTFVADLGVGPYHVIPNDADAPAGLWDWAVGEAARLGDDLPFEPPPEPVVPPDPYAVLSDLRWQRETGGLTLPDGTIVSTTRESQSLIIGTVLGIQTGLITGPVPWKANSGWVDMNGPEIIALGAAVAQHVQRCFAAERAVSVALDLDPLLDLAAAFDAAYAGG